ncbi:protein of unknown function (plasmid) [Cupriavidus taiwanensis]|nr:protein of unknown function [Cupriavidus taiwanensis]
MAGGHPDKLVSCQQAADILRTTARLSSWSGEQSPSRLRIDLGKPQIIDLNLAKIGLTIDFNFAGPDISTLPGH